MQISLATLQVLADIGDAKAQSLYAFFMNPEAQKQWSPANSMLVIYWNNVVGDNALTWHWMPKPRMQRQVIACNGTCDPDCALCQRQRIRVSTELPEDETLDSDFCER